LKEIDEILSLGLCDGITTNPSLMAKSGVKDIQKMIHDICQYDIYDVSVELIDPFLSIDKLVDEATEYYMCCMEKVVVKVPMIDTRTSELINALKRKHIPVNLTCLMSAYQAIIGLESEPYYISLFYRRMIDFKNFDYAKEQIRITAEYLQRFGSGDRPLLICGSIRSPEDVQVCMDSGADIVTVPYKVLNEMYKHPKTEEAVKEFTEKWKTALKPVV
jgi:transaldolase